MEYKIHIRLMTKFQIPKRFRSGFREIGKLEEENASEIAKFLSKVEVGTGPNSILSAIPEGFVAIFESEPKLEEAFRTLFSLIILIEKEGAEINDLVEDLTSSFNETEKGEDIDFVNRLERNLKTLLHASPNLFLTFKGMRLQNEYSKIFRDSTIYSDIRIVFNEALSNSNQSAVVTHLLKVEYDYNEESKTEFYAMSRENLENLKKVIDRALEKEENIKSNYKGDLNFIEITS